MAFPPLLLVCTTTPASLYLEEGGFFYTKKKQRGRRRKKLGNLGESSARVIHRGGAGRPFLRFFSPSSALIHLRNYFPSPIWPHVELGFFFRSGERGRNIIKSVQYRKRVSRIFSNFFYPESKPCNLASDPGKAGIRPKERERRRK